MHVSILGINNHLNLQAECDWTPENSQDATQGPFRLALVALSAALDQG